MIRGCGLYRDGRPVREGIEPIEPGSALEPLDISRLEQMWDVAKQGGDDSFVWLGLREVDVAELELAARLFGINELHVEDALSLGQRAKVEVDRDRVSAVFKLLDYVEESSDVETGQIAVFVGPSYVLSVRQGEPGDLRDLRRRLEASNDLLTTGPMAVLWGILDVVVDGYQNVVDELAQDIEQVEERVFSPARTDDAATIYRLKRENLEVRRALEPLRPVADKLLHERLIPIPDDLEPYYRDLGDHLLRVAELSAQHDTLLGTVLEAARSRQQVQQNEDMRKISAWVAIAAVPTAVAGIYGMNFDNMPELRWEYGYYAVLGFVVVVCGLLFRAFKRSGWL